MCTCNDDVIPHLPIPGHPRDILKRVDLVPGAHGAVWAVQIPDENLRLAGSRGKQVGLEGVNVECSHRSHVLGVLGYHGIWRSSERVKLVKIVQLIESLNSKDTPFFPLT